MSAWARPGVKCECINDALDADKTGWEPGYQPVKGSIYTVASAPFTSSKTGNILIALCEHPYPLRADRFRPVITRTQSQDLELFVPLLTRVGEPA